MRTVSSVGTTEEIKANHFKARTKIPRVDVTGQEAIHRGRGCYRVVGSNEVLGSKTFRQVYLVTDIDDVGCLPVVDSTGFFVSANCSNRSAASLGASWLAISA